MVARTEIFGFSRTFSPKEQYVGKQYTQVREYPKSADTVTRTYL